MRQGMGSTLHVAAVFLGQALQHGHIFLWDPKGWHVGREYVDGGCGRGMGYSNWDWSAVNLSETLPSDPLQTMVLTPFALCATRAAVQQHPFGLHPSAP